MDMIMANERRGGYRNMFRPFNLRWFMIYSKIGIENMPTRREANYYFGRCERMSLKNYGQEGGNKLMPRFDDDKKFERYKRSMDPLIFEEAERRAMAWSDFAHALIYGKENKAKEIRNSLDD